MEKKTCLFALLINFLFLFYTVAYWIQIGTLPERETVVVNLLLLLFGLLTVLQIVRNVVRLFKMKGERKLTVQFEQEAGKILHSMYTSKPLMAVIAITIYIVLFSIIGFYVSSYLFLLLINHVLGIRNKFIITGFPILFLVIIHLIFSILLGVPLPKGILF